MESQVVPYFKFLWIMSRGENTADKNELLRRVEQYTSTMKLLREDSPVAHSCSIVTSLDQLIDSLKPMQGYMPVFVLIGHGYAETGAMPMWSGEALDPNSLLSKWRCTFKCDFIACGCGANVFVSPMQYPILLCYNRQVRFLAAAEPLNETSHIYNDGSQQRHLELTQLMLQYLMVYDNGGTQAEITKADAFVQVNRRTAKQCRKDKEKAELVKQVRESVKAESEKLNQWSQHVKQKWQAWGEKKEQWHQYKLKRTEWQYRLFVLFCFMLLIQLIDLLHPRSTGSLFCYAVVDTALYAILFD